jgi:hypothetical protein
MFGGEAGLRKTGRFDGWMLALTQAYAESYRRQSNTSPAGNLTRCFIWD